MTIKEIETLTGMTRANIRFYEAEGLIAPKRNRENGYRIYSQEDVEALRKIRLLRLMEVPIDQIRVLQAQEASLVWTLEQHLQELEARKGQLSRSQEVARQMISRKEDYDTMDATIYLDAMENGGNLDQDVKPKLNLPWRRYWARGLDFLFCTMLIAPLFVKLIPGWRYGYAPLALIAMLLLEPLALHLFATTPGKLIFGIRVTDPDGKRLSYNAAMERTWTVLWEGMALRIPLLELYFEYRALSDAEEGEPLPWEWDSELTFVDDKKWRYLILLAIYGAVYANSIRQILGGG